MKSNFRTAILILMALLVTAFLAAAEAPANAEDVAAIKVLFDKHLAAFDTGDAAAAATLFTDKEVMMAPNRPALMGKEAIQWGLDITFAPFGAQNTGDVLELEIAGDRASARRTYAIMLTGKIGGEEMELNARRLDVPKRQPDALWKIHSEMVYSDHPLPDAGELGGRWPRKPS